MAFKATPGVKDLNKLQICPYKKGPDLPTICPEISEFNCLVDGLIGL
jgi:hypothetical protein